LIGFASLVSGAWLIYRNAGTDSGYTISDTYEVRTSTHAYWMRMSALKLESWYSKIGIQLFGADQLAQAKWVVKSPNSGKEIFAGLVSAAAATDYLNSMETEGPYPYWEWNTGPFYADLNITTTKVFNGLSGLTRSPAEESIWASSESFIDQATLYWDPYWSGMENDKYLIIMNLDGSSGIQADIQLGFKTPIFDWLQYLLAVIGSLLLFVSYIILKH
jgi:hypothetical protein